VPFRIRTSEPVAKRPEPSQIRAGKWRKQPSRNEALPEAAVPLPGPPTMAGSRKFRREPRHRISRATTAAELQVRLAMSMDLPRLFS